MKRNKEKHIVFLVSNDLSFDQRMSRISNSLFQNGFEVTLCGRENSESWKLEDKGYNQFRVKTIFKSGPLFYFNLNFNFFFFLIFKNFDAICAIDLDTAPAAWIVAKLRKKVLIYDAHELFTDVPELLEHPRKRKIWERVARLIISASDLRYTVNETLAAVFKDRYGYDFHSIQNFPILPDSFRKALVPPILKKWKKEGQFIIMYQGWINKGRGVEQAMEALVAIPNSVLLLAGGGDLIDHLKIKVKKLGIEQRVRFMEWVAPAELYKLTAHVDCGINLLEADSQNYYFSLANKHLDYIMAGIPSISMNFPEYSRINDFSEVSILLERCESGELIQAIEKLMSDEDYYNQLSKNAKELRLKLNWQNEEKKLLEYYRDLF